jgi:hypothetical protein
MLTLVTYAANTGVPPDDPSLPLNERWRIQIQSPPAPQATAQIIAGPPQVLSIVNPGPGVDPDQPGGLAYFRFEEELNLDNVIFEINCKVTSVTPAPGINPFGFGFLDKVKSLEAGLTAEKIYFVATNEFPVAPENVEFGMNTTDTFHTSRIVKNGEGYVELWVGRRPKIENTLRKLGKTHQHRFREPTDFQLSCREIRVGHRLCELQHFFPLSPVYGKLQSRQEGRERTCDANCFGDNVAVTRKGGSRRSLPTLLVL